MKIKSWLTLLSPLAVATPLIAVACGRTEDSPELIAQKNKVKNAEINKYAELFWLNSTLKSIYKIDTDAKIIDNKAFLNDAYQSYKIWLDNQYLTTDFNLGVSLSNWKKIASFSEDELKILDNQFSDLNVSKAIPNIDQFKILYSTPKTDVSYNVNKLLLVKKYFEIADSSELEKVAKSTYDSKKDTYQLDQLLLIDYVLSTRIAQIWNYSSSSDNDIFSNLTRSIETIKDYEELLKNTDAALKVAQSDVLFNDPELEESLGGYQGLSSKLNSYKLDFSKEHLLTLKDSSTLSGFYDFTNNKLIPVEKDGKLKEAIKITGDNKTINVTYLNMIAPVLKEIPGEKDTNKKILSFDNTSYAPKLNQLKLAVAIYGGDSLYKSAQKAFVTLGNVIKIKDELVEEKLKGVDFVKE